MTIKQAKEIDMVDYLFKLGHEPASIKGKDYWYKSPLGSEKTPSFKVNRALNKWYDFREGRGGNLVDFGIVYHQCSISELLQKLSSPTIAIKQHAQYIHAQDNNKNKIEIISANPVTSFTLLRYLNYRRIDPEVAYKHVKEVRYKIGDKTYYALGFKNDSGYELRNEKFKGSSSPSISILSSDTSISRSRHLEQSVQARITSSLSSGEFVGIVADNPEQPIELKALHCRIINGHDKLRKKQKHPLPKQTQKRRQFT